LGQTDRLVGVSHECDYPPEVNAKPRVTHCPIHKRDCRVPRSTAGCGRLWPRRGRSTAWTSRCCAAWNRTSILTQRLCDVCAVGFGSVMAFAATMPGHPQVMNLEPSSLADIFENIRCVAKVLGVPERAEAAVAALAGRVEAVQSRLAHVAHRPKCFLMEWIDPPFCSGHWGPELVQLAGGTDPLGLKGKDSTRIPWEGVLDAQPDVIVLACCGHRPQRTISDLPILRGYPGWDGLPAVRHGRVYAVDGSAYFSRPGPRIVDSLEILAEVIHPELFAGRFPDRGVVCVGTAASHP